jgi:cell wall-associated NlpC family hydrolase
MTEDEERARVVTEAESWLGTPYHSNADVKGVGVDCGMLLVRIFVDSGMVPPFDPRPYPPQWHLHNRAERYMGIVKQFAHEIEWPPKSGDVCLFQYGLCYAHGAVITKWPMVIHAIGIGGGSGFVIPANAERDVFVKHLRKRFFSVWPRARARAKDTEGQRAPL